MNKSSRFFQSTPPIEIIIMKWSSLKKLWEKLNYGHLHERMTWFNFPRLRLNLAEHEEKEFLLKHFYLTYSWSAGRYQLLCESLSCLHRQRRRFQQDQKNIWWAFISYSFFASFFKIWQAAPSFESFKEFLHVKKRVKFHGNICSYRYRVSERWNWRNLCAQSILWDLWNNEWNVNLLEKSTSPIFLSLMFQLKVFYWTQKELNFAFCSFSKGRKRIFPNVYLAETRKKVLLLLLKHFIIQLI